MTASVGATIPSPSRIAVDFEERIDFGRLRDYRLARSRQALERAELGSLLTFDVNNIRYLTATMIGEWARDKMARYALLARGAEPFVWDFGSAARHHQLHSPWLRPENSRVGMLGLRGSVAPEAGLFHRAAREIKGLLEDAGVADLPVGVDIAEPPMVFALQELGLDVRDGQQVMLDAREIKSPDEIALLPTAAAIVDGTHQTIVDALKPGIRENEVEVPDGEILDTLGSARVLRAGSDCTILALAAMVPRALSAAELAAVGIEATVVDVRSLVPLDTSTLLASAAATGRLFTVEENPRLCGWGAEVVSIAVEEIWSELSAPPVRITTPHVPLPAADALEDHAIPSTVRIVETIGKSLCA